MDHVLDPDGDPVPARRAWVLGKAGASFTQVVVVAWLGSIDSAC